MNEVNGDVRSSFKSYRHLDAKARAEFYDKWAENYEKDHSVMGYRAPHLAVDVLSQYFRGNQQDALVLDVACGTGWVAKLMLELGFTHFEGVDSSQGMLDEAEKINLYQNLQLALLGTDPLPTRPGVFDVVMIVGALDVGFCPVTVVRELCQAAKPGGLVCMARGDHTSPASQKYKQDLELELQQMTEEGLWRMVGINPVDGYMKNPLIDDQSKVDQTPAIPGIVYVYEKC